MIPWIQVYSNLTSHRKTGRLADELGLTNNFVSPDVVAVGILISLWTWAIQNASNGDLSDCSARIIAEACRWRKKPEQLIAALKSSGWMDEDGRLHDWEEYTCLLLAQEDNRKERDKERARRYRENKKNSQKSDTSRDASRDDDVIVTQKSAPTRHNITIPDITEQDNNKSIYLSEERKEEKKESPKRDGSAWDDPDTWIKMARMAKNFGWTEQVGNYIAKARTLGVIIDPETMEVSYE